MKEITEQQIGQRANEIGSRPAFPHSYDGLYVDEMSNGTLMKNGYCSGSTGITYRMWLIGQYVANPTGRKEEILNDVQYVLECLAKAEIEAEQEVSND